MKHLGYLSRHAGDPNDPGPYATRRITVEQDRLTAKSWCWGGGS